MYYIEAEDTTVNIPATEGSNLSQYLLKLKPMHILKPTRKLMYELPSLLRIRKRMKKPKMMIILTSLTLRDVNPMMRIVMVMIMTINLPSSTTPSLSSFFSDPLTAPPKSLKFPSIVEDQIPL